MDKANSDLSLSVFICGFNSLVYSGTAAHTIARRLPEINLLHHPFFFAQGLSSSTIEAGESEINQSGRQAVVWARTSIAQPRKTVESL